MKKIYLNFLLIIFSALFAHTQEIKLGDLDKGFGNLGVADLSSSFTIGSDTYYPSYVSATAVQTDGKILAGALATGPYPSKGFVLFRLNTNGTLDNSFGSGGRAYVEITDASGVKCIAIQNDGKILLGGDAPFENAVVVRFNINGSPDNTFSDDGIFQIDYTTTWGGSCNSIGIQSTGKIILAGKTSGGGSSQVFLMRLNANGMSDLSFTNLNDYGYANDGIILLPVSNMLYGYYYDFNVANSIAIQQIDNKIVVTGNTGPIQSTFVLRLLADGGTEYDFGGNYWGIRTFDVIIGGGRNYSTGHVVKIQSFNGPLVIVGSTFSTETNTNKYFMIRLLNTGYNDNSFDGDGLKIIDHVAKNSDPRYSNFPPIPSFAIEPSNGKFLIAGSTPDLVDPYHTNLAFYRLKTDGSMDDCFGENGILSFTDYRPGDTRYSLALQSNGQAISLTSSPKVLRLILNGSSIKINNPVSNSSFTQKWTWIKGDNIIDQLPVYGTQQISDPLNNPGGMTNISSWQTDDGKLWIFGGHRLLNNTTLARSNSLWKYDLSNNQWTWMKGSTQLSQPGTYGTLGIPSTNNNPGGRSRAGQWKDNDGNLWVFGGLGMASTVSNGSLNDLWKYNPAANTWTWMGGSNLINMPGNYGTQSIANTANIPGARSGAATWTDVDGNFWMFGGQGLGSVSNVFGLLNDLWKYNPVTNEWTWVNGNSTVQQPDKFVAKGIADPLNKPGGKYSPSGWYINGNFYMMGGDGLTQCNDRGNLNDIWKYNHATNIWTYLKGDNKASWPGYYGEQGVPNPLNRPGSRQGAMTIIDKAGRLLMFGGLGSASDGQIDALNDFWKYDPASNNWIWLNGGYEIGQAGVYGTMGLPDNANKPGGKALGGAFASDNGDVYLLGGFGYGSESTSGWLNDLWKLSPSNTILSCPANVTITPPVGLCYAVVNNIDPIITPSGSSPIIVYTLTGATTANGTGSASGSTFNVGITTVTYSLPENNSKNCSFTVTVIDNQNPTITCPADISVTTTEGTCEATVIYNAPVATDNCFIPPTSLTTNFSGDRRAAGNMFNIIALNTIIITDFDARFLNPINNISVYFKVGTHVGFENNAGAWTLIGSVSNVISQGINVPTSIPLPINITIPAGQTYAFYITVTNGGNLGYSSGTSVGAVAASDGNIQILEGTGNNYPFILAAQPRTWNGQVHYKYGTVPVITQTKGLASGSVFPSGITTNTFLATDASGNTATCSFTVTVNYPVTPAMTISTSEVSNNFCNGILLTVNSNVPVQSYSWSNGVTTQSNFLTTANASGTYTVNAVSASGCPAIPPANFIYDKQAVTSSYTLLATNSIKLQQNNTVVNGSAGVVNLSGIVSLKKNVSINGAGAFLKAQSVSLQAPYTIPSIVYAPALVTLPTMQYNTTSTSGLANATVPNGTTTTLVGNFKNVTIGTNCNVTLTGSIFGAITIGSGSSATFSQSSIDVTAITLNAGTVSANTQLKFSGDAIVRCAGSILVNTRSIMNPDNHKVIIYLGKTSGAPVTFTVAAGGNETVNVSFYIPSGKISVGGDASNMTYMNGKFVAENIESLDKNVFWNWYDCTPSAFPPLITSKNKTIINEQPGKPSIGLNIKAWPNPSEHQFTLNVESNSNKPVNITVYDMFGRKVYSTTGTANKQYQFGNRFVSGAYIAEVSQGVNHSAVKLIKQ